MDAELTLKLDQEIIEKAKAFASKNNLNLSEMVENYFSSLTNEVKDENTIQISPFVKSLATGVKIPADLDYKKEYSNFLAEKYK